MLEQIKARIIEIEAAIQETVSRHAVLTGHLTEAKHFLDMAAKISQELAPDNVVTECLQVADNIVDAICPE